PPVKLVTRPPASRTMRLPAAVSQGESLYSQKPSKRPQATKQRSSAAEPSRLTPWDISVSVENLTILSSCDLRVSGGNPVASMLAESADIDETFMRSSFIHAPCPFSAQKSSRLIGLKTAPNVISPRSSKPIETE